MKAEMMNVSLTPELAEFVRGLVEKGEYSGQSEAVREGLRLLKHQQQLREAEHQAVREKIERGWQQSERSEVVSGEHVREHFARKSSDRRRRRA